ncbi:DUF4163 domain-containing protein [Porphyrobacter sp. GA68]|uniref:DUF4163 domain-containing protein n=1 Tax=Porphyrobacter sp. GA68 TaxID=2883480 RepID=UPI001D180C80|nr:DUF4163 domain-containing protein [Porphyrobacter sp. GA68]
MRRTLLIILPLLATGGCSQTDLAEEGRSARTAAATVSAHAGQAGSVMARSNGAKAVAQADGVLEYKFSYPATVGSIPQLAQQIDARAEEARSAARSAAEADRATAETDDYPFRPHYLSLEWTVVADLPEWLSLSNAIATYTGGAHGMSGVESLVWDKRNGRALDPVAMFTSPEALDQAVRARYCRALDVQRREKREGDRLGGEFEECPAVTALTVLPGSSNGRTFDRLTLYAGPYVAGPYAEGSYEIAVPVDAAVVAAVKPQYRSAFSGQ